MQSYLCVMQDSMLRDSLRTSRERQSLFMHQYKEHLQASSRHQAPRPGPLSQSLPISLQRPSPPATPEPLPSHALEERAPTRKPPPRGEERSRDTSHQGSGGLGGNPDVNVGGSSAPAVRPTPLWGRSMLSENVHDLLSVSYTIRKI